MPQTLAIDGGIPVRTVPFPTWPVFDEREERLLLEVLHSGHWSELTGDKVTTFIDRFAEFQGARYGVCLPNGTLALELAMQTLEIGPGDEVITTPYTFIATASSILNIGARPVFADIDPCTYNIAPETIEAAITPRTKAIVPVHIAGQPADLDAIMDIARRHNLAVVEDACQAWGARWRDQGAGTIGDLGCFSFQMSKNITAGEGGLVLTNNPDLHDQCWSLHNLGRIRGGGWYQHEILGRNLRMTEWQGAILLAQLERLPEQMTIRDRNAQLFTERINASIVGLTPARIDARVSRHGQHLFMMRYNADAFGGRSRDDFVAALRAEGITPVNSGYPPLPRTPAIQRAFAERFGPESVATLASCPVAEKAGRETVWLGPTALIGAEVEVDDVVSAVAKIQTAWAN